MFRPVVCGGLIVIAGGYACRVFVFKLIVIDCLLPVAPVYIHMLLAVLSSCVCVCVCEVSTW